MTADTLYERLGGPGKADKAIAAVVDAFYERILANPELAPFFKNTDMVRQAKHQTNFVTFAFGGPNRYSGRAMNAAHKKLRDEHGMSDKHFDLVAQTLAATMLEDFQLDQATVDEAIAIVATTREQVMGRAE
ncbi:unnamed protein product [Pedinophyceae sp. YPF-701]|nr:unnamed protein product [Pedinophyceae sp. YPF-701]